MEMPSRSFSSNEYRYGFNGKENDNEVKGSGNQQDYGMRIYDVRLARFLSVDPITKDYPELTPYQFASNTPIWGDDLDGLELKKRNHVRHSKNPSGVGFMGRIFGIEYRGKYYKNTVRGSDKNKTNTPKDDSDDSDDNHEPEEVIINSKTNVNYSLQRWTGLYNNPADAAPPTINLPNTFTEPRDEDKKDIDELGTLFKNNKLVGDVEVRVNTNYGRRFLRTRFNRALRQSNQQRQNAIVNYLKKAGVPENKIKIKKTKFSQPDWDVRIEAKKID